MPSFVIADLDQLFFSIDFDFLTNTLNLGWSFVSRQQTQNLLSQPLSITYFMKEFTKKERISERVRWDGRQI
jgi:hypothetical protein